MRRQHDAPRLIDRAAKALFPDAPSASLAEALFPNAPPTIDKKLTVKAWREGRRRPPKCVLEKIRWLLQARVAEMNGLWRELGDEIFRRDGEPFRPLTGCCKGYSRRPRDLRY